MKIDITIDGHPVSVQSGQSVLDGARALGIDIPTLCYLEKCGPLTSCLVCLVKINGKLVPSCATKAQTGMVVESETDEIYEARRTALELLFSDHLGDCLAPCHRLCPLGMNIPVMLRQIQAGNLREAIATVKEALPLPAILGRLCHHPCEQGCRRGTWDDSASIRDLERLAADEDWKSAAPYLPPRKPESAKTVAIIGSGPTGLAAAYYLLRLGYQCTIADRHEDPGGSLRYDLDEATLPRAVLDAELAQFRRLGAQFKLGLTLSHDFTLDGLLRQFDAVLLTVGQISKAEGEGLGCEMVPAGIKIDPETYQTNRPAVFAAGRAVRPLDQLVRAMREGQRAGEAIQQFLLGKKIQPAPRPFSSVMGRLHKDELRQFVQGRTVGTVVPRDLCAGFTPQEGALEASRCLHCDCRSSGNCALQHYAQVYGADANRFKTERRHFEQQVQPGGVIFEAGKCIVCGICVKLTELAREPLGLTFIGRGFDVRLAAPFNESINAGLQKVAAECVEHCPTGALAFDDLKTGPGGDGEQGGVVPNRHQC